VTALDHTPPPAVAVVGADGFIGSAVTRRALSDGAPVTAICTKEPWRLAGMIDDPRLSLIGVPRGRWWEHEFLAELAPTLGRCDAIALLAYTPASGEGPPLAEERATNVAGAEAIGRIAARFGRRLVFTSSADVYGLWRDEPVDERTEPEPRSPYAQAKLEAEARLLEVAAAETVILRLSTVFGPGEDGPRAIPSFIRALLGNEAPLVHGRGVDVKDYIHVDDVASAIVTACRRPLPSPINVGSGVGRSTAEILEAVVRAMGVEARARHVPSPRRPSRLVLNTTLAQRRLGLSPREDLIEALAEEAEWLARKHRHTVEVGA
jgi:UDP-glucose 4-epimerase